MNSFFKNNGKKVANVVIAAALLTSVSVLSAAGNARNEALSESLSTKIEPTEMALTTGATAGASLYTACSLSLYEDAALPDTEVSEVSTASNDLAVTASFDPTYYGYTNLGIARVTEGNLNIRKKADVESALVGKMANNCACEILGEENGFLKIKSGEVEGYVKAEYVLQGQDALLAAPGALQTMAEISGSGVNVRAKSNTDSAILGVMKKGTKLLYIGEENGFAKIDFNSGDAYVRNDLVEVKQMLPEAMTISEALYGKGVSSVRQALVNYALQFVGNRYVWGGTSLTNGIDCSGFTMRIYEKYGISLPHYSGSQANCGRRIKPSQAKPGDLLFYGGSRINHVAIYIGDGQIVHAASARTGIIVSASRSNPVCAISLLD